MRENSLRLGQWNFLTSLFTLREKIKLFLLFSAQLVLSFLDLAGIAIFGLLGALAVNGVSYKEPGSRLLMVLRTLNLEGFDFRLQAAILGVLATILLVARTILAIFFTRKTLSFLGSKSARVSATLFQSVMQSDYQRIKGLTLNEWIAGLTKGINSLIIRVIGGLVTIIADLFLTLLILSGLFIYNFQVALMTVLMFSVTGFSLYALVRNKAEQTGFLEQQTEIELNQRISESILAFREIHLSNDQEFYSKKIRDLRLKQVNSQTISAFFPLLSKYVFEAILIVGTLLVGAVQFLLFDAVQAVASLSIFMVASTRIAPAIMRIQQSAVILKSSLGSSSISFSLLQEFSSGKRRLLSDSLGAEQFIPTIELKKVRFRHSQSAEPIFNGFDLRIEKGSVVALVGPTGSGKSTLVDLILGVTKNESGEVLISGQPARIAIRSWPRKVAYVPQKVAVFNTSVRENIALGSSINSTSDEEIWAALDRAELSDFVKSLPGMLDYKIFDQGLNLSGGQLQRIGIARALLTIPEILVFDEATSALDGQTEASISKTIQSLGSTVTVLIIAHRLSSIKDVSRVVYLNQGKILADGTFNQVREQVPSFDLQCSELGI
jgi:ABC-type multidrug transport system fused ATPase/permease subunit